MLTIADIVISLNGRDAGKRFIVIDTIEQYSLIADGKGRRFEKPKKKKNKHLKYEDKASGILAEKLKKEKKITNNELRRLLAEYTASMISNESKLTDKGGAPNA